MNTKQMKEIAIWLQSGNTGSSSRYLLSRLMGGEIANQFPLDLSDVKRCFELYKNCEFVRNNIGVVYNEMYLGIFPIWKKLFTIYYPVYEKTEDSPNWRLNDETCYIQTIKQLKKIGKEYTMDNNQNIIYTANDTQYIRGKDSVKAIPLTLLDEVKKAQQKYDEFFDYWKQNKQLTPEQINQLFEYSNRNLLRYLDLQVSNRNWLEYQRTLKPTLIK